MTGSPTAQNLTARCAGNLNQNLRLSPKIYIRSPCGGKLFKLEQIKQIYFERAAMSNFEIDFRPAGSNTFEEQCDDPNKKTKAKPRQRRLAYTRIIDINQLKRIANHHFLQTFTAWRNPFRKIQKMLCSNLLPCKNAHFLPKSFRKSRKDITHCASNSYEPKTANFSENAISAAK